MRALFDTCILIDYLNGVSGARREIEQHPDRLISSITWMEVLAGAHDEAEADVIEMFLRDFRVVELSRRIAREAVPLRTGHRLRLPDAIIWATARVEGAELITRNTKDFRRGTAGVRVPYSQAS
jgi:predicted nucleic acid-binding protein